MMNDSSGGGLSDLRDIDDLEMIMQQVQAEQEQEEEAEQLSVGNQDKRKLRKVFFAIRELVDIVKKTLELGARGVE
ncbi:hypothetical protein Tco_0366235 [Tanacetum coccineum]